MRAELTLEIKDEARRQLAVDGAPGLSLRAVTRALGMASSAIYRYFASRDDLLTALIVDAYDAVGAAAEEANACCPPEDFGGRWRAVGLAVRNWALANPNEYALVYGSPVPGYRAPEDTIGPASRVTLVLAGMVDEAARAGALVTPAEARALPPLDVAVLEMTRQLADQAFPHAPDDVVVRAMVAWTQLFGMISFELFGHFHSVIDDVGPIFERSLLETGRLVGFPSPATGLRRTEVGRERSAGASTEASATEGEHRTSQDTDDTEDTDEAFYLI